MARYPQEQLEKQYQKLPDVLKEALFSVEVANKIFEIGKKFGLTIEKIGLMADEIGNLILGLTSPRNFTRELKNGLEVDENLARDIAAEINHQIFFKLREALKETHQFEVARDIFKPAEFIPRTTEEKPPLVEGLASPRAAPKIETPRPPAEPPKPEMPAVKPEIPQEFPRPEKMPDGGILAEAPEKPPKRPPTPPPPSPQISPKAVPTDPYREPIE